ncbi:tRNA (adenosine(37)-N6)-threonylcarbamoyltransferase complex dimerization subunit type 1 TsaB [Variovorax sp. PBS-H4]|uniref:tRNA (adenosine(37)-N6)-threonylcarbamoyltransferase complex dimerization subunit type 1 TsaB n=1 Tax=Variovorax sp. PBS-H4 TaxID=434008 RepID=UPI0013A55DA3|nr:tRNA (adenosine(37)-N6)-threonylcarbamoyltransferase complex dimerization subunit type 1 TsaB [Variovorax sp. PBS-H4]
MPAPTKLLAFDTSTEWLSVAVRHGEHLLSRTSAGGAQASSSLIPLIQELLAEAGLAMAELDAIAFGRGPGSFTGLRTACSVAQGLGFGAGVRLLPVDTLHAVAEEARHRFGATRVVALLDARMDELYAAHYDFGQPARSEAEPLLLSPEQVQVPPGWALAGNVFAAYGARLPAATACHEVLPAAEAMLRLAPELLAAGGGVPPAQAWPLYVRDKVAQTTEERAALKATRATGPT